MPSLGTASSVNDCSLLSDKATLVPFGKISENKFYLSVLKAFIYPEQCLIFFLAVRSAEDRHNFCPP
jgi:hypothetical protein